MSILKIVKDAHGRTVGYGPNADFYQPTVPDGGTLEYGDEAAIYAPEPAGQSFAELKAVEVAYWKAEREKMIARMNSIQDQLNAIGDTAGAASCRALRQSLLGLFTDPAVVAATDMPALKAAFKARYKVATDLASMSAKLEFVRYEL